MRYAITTTNGHDMPRYEISIIPDYDAILRIDIDADAARDTFLVFAADADIDVTNVAAEHDYDTTFIVSFDATDDDARAYASHFDLDADELTVIV